MDKNDLFNMITNAGYGFLATGEGDQARVRPMRPCVSDAGTILISVLPGRRCVPQVELNPKVEMCFMGGDELSHCRITGVAVMSDDVAKKEELLDKAPDLYKFLKGVDDPNYGLMEITLTYAEIMPPGIQQPISIDV